MEFNGSIEWASHKNTKLKRSVNVTLDPLTCTNMGCCSSAPVYAVLPSSEDLFAGRAKPDGDDFIQMAIIGASGMFTQQVGIFSLDRNGADAVDENGKPLAPVPGQKFEPSFSGNYLYQNVSKKHEDAKPPYPWLYNISAGATHQVGHNEATLNHGPDSTTQYKLDSATKKITVCNNPEGLSFYDNQFHEKWEVTIDKAYDVNDNSTFDGITFNISNDYKVTCDADTPGMYSLSLHSRVLGVMFDPSLAKYMADAGVVASPRTFPEIKAMMDALLAYKKGPTAVYVNATLSAEERDQTLCLLVALSNRILQSINIDGAKSGSIDFSALQQPGGPGGNMGGDIRGRLSR